MAHYQSVKPRCCHMFCSKPSSACLLHFCFVHCYQVTHHHQNDLTVSQPSQERLQSQPSNLLLRHRLLPQSDQWQHQLQPWLQLQRPQSGMTTRSPCKNFKRFMLAMLLSQGSPIPRRSFSHPQQFIQAAGGPISGYQTDDSKLTVLLKWCMSHSGEMSFENMASILVTCSNWSMQQGQHSARRWSWRQSTSIAGSLFQRVNSTHSQIDHRFAARKCH